MSFCVAIDGPAAAGKGTIARAVAAEFGLAHLDTGLLYRAVGARMLAGEAPIPAAQALTAEDVADEGRLRKADVAQAASKVAVIPEVRAALLDFQRAFAARAGGAVLDGRDIGTVICPDAAVKFFVTASVEARAERRYAELVERGFEADLSEVAADVAERDARDRGRADSPMVAAEGAILLDTSLMSREEAVAAAIDAVRAAGGAPG
ncbi:MAG: (d)CMP kinase [Pseudomonadota bacterium]